MGVKGLTTFLKRRHPSCVEAHLLESMRGRAIALDAQLFTQRFFYGTDQISQPDAAVIMWRSFVRRSRDEYDIRPIAVFDGPHRIPQKAREGARRQAARELSASRAAFEDKRSERLVDLAKVLGELGRMDVQERVETMASFQAGAGARPVAERPAEPPPVAVEPPPLVEPSTVVEPPAQPTLASLHASYAATADDVVQSVNQRVSTAIERDIFDTLLRRPLESFTDESTLEDERRTDVIARQSADRAVAYRTSAASITPRLIETCKDMITALGVPVLQVSEDEVHEGEALAAALFHAGHVDAVASEDTDVLLYDAPLLRSLTSPDGAIVRMCPRKIRSSFDFSRSQFLDFALLLGTDFCETIFGIGPIKGAALIAKHGSIEAIVDQLLLTNPRLIADGYLDDVVAAREIFNRLPAIPSRSFEQRSEDADAVDEITRRLAVSPASRFDQSGELPFSEDQDDTLRYV